jgi:hypothetical protein
MSTARLGRAYALSDQLKLRRPVSTQGAQNQIEHIVATAQIRSVRPPGIFNTIGSLVIRFSSNSSRRRTFIYAPERRLIVPALIDKGLPA